MKYVYSLNEIYDKNPMNEIEIDPSSDPPQVRFIVNNITLTQALAVAAALYPERQAASK